MLPYGRAERHKNKHFVVFKNRITDKKTFVKKNL